MSKMRTLILSVILSSCYSLQAHDDKPTVYFNCGKDRIWADFHDGDKLDLTLGRVTYVMHQVKSGSGARYETPKGAKPHVVFWNKGTQASLTIDKKQFPRCHQEK
ncbi:MAG: MliC family protein [Proteobacteria bacterium]|nr:MliC family protein [Pseudomonadota bacterium]